MRVTSQEHLISTINSMITTNKQVNKDSLTHSKERVSMIDSICDSSTNILDSVDFCVCDLVELAANWVGQIMLIRLIRLERGRVSSREFAKDLWEASLI